MTNRDCFLSILTHEVLAILKKLKSGKAPGPDEILNEHLKNAMESLAAPMAVLFNKIMTTKTIPKQWCESEIILLFKKGDRCEISNYRPISLSSNMGKILMKIIKNRIYDTLDRSQPPEQAGFRKKFSTVDHIQTLTQIIEKTKEYRIDVVLAFIDFNKAFDSIYHHSAWKALATQGVPENIINILENLYQNSVAHIALDKKGDIFKVGRGVKQGDPLSPNIFNAVLEDVFRKLEWDNYGLKIDGVQINNLRFADDIVLIGKNSEEINVMIEDLVQQGAKVGLSINLGKSKIMTKDGKKDEHLRPSAAELEMVDEYKYLGQTVSFKNRSDKEIKIRINNSWKAFWAQKHIFKSNMKMKTKAKILSTGVLPVATYGAQTWPIARRHLKKLKVMQNSMFRSILKIKLKDKIKLLDIKEKIKVKDIGYIIRKLKWKYAGHLMREKNFKWHKTATDWTPYGHKRARGRPMLRWRDDFKELGRRWIRLARDRDIWREMVETYALKWAG